MLYSTVRVWVKYHCLFYIFYNYHPVYTAGPFLVCILGVYGDVKYFATQPSEPGGKRLSEEKKKVVKAKGADDGVEVK